MMLYVDVPLVTDRGLPLDETLELDFSGHDPTAAELIFQARPKNGDPQVLLDLRATRGEVAAQPTAEGRAAVTISASRAQMLSVPHGAYAYGLLAVWPDGFEALLCRGAWTHRALIVAKEG